MGTFFEKHAFEELMTNSNKSKSAIRSIVRSFKSDGYMVACATNSIRETAKLQLIRKGFFEYIDFMYSNQDVKNPKPNSIPLVSMFS